MTPAERIAGAVQLVREGKSIDEAHRETLVTSDVIKKACKAAGLDTRPKRRTNMGPGNLWRMGVHHAASPSELGRYRSSIGKRLREEQANRGWRSDPLGTRIARDELGLKETIE